jgi:ABC-type amino acid transport substrate-binding protein
MNLQGIGIDIAEQIFAELDVPIEETIYSDPTEMAKAFRSGKIDLIVSTYNDSSLQGYATILQPAYLDDPITVAMPINASQNITDWDSLVGLTGVKEIGLIPDDQTNEFFMSYLQITNKENLLANLEAVKKGEYQYIVGSDLQLTYAININNLSSDLRVMKNLIKPGEVHMAFASNSPCKLYAVYVQKRLQDYRNNGTVEKTVKKYRY